MVMRAFLAGRSIVILPTEACESFFLRYARTLMSSFNIVGKCLLLAYHLDDQSRLTARRKPVGCIFCPMIYSFFPSPTVTWMWQVCLRITLPRPLARAVKRRRLVALSR